MPALYPADEVKRRVLTWAVKLRVNPRAIRIQKMSNKWGSCSSGGTITLASDLVDEERPFQDYVIVHELLHLRYSGHGRVFRAVLRAHVPGWRRIEASRIGIEKKPEGIRSLD
jgi:predicted metal-dependent hydrolase